MESAPSLIEAVLAGAAFDVVAVGASAGGLPALRKLVLSLPPRFELPVIAMLHLAPEGQPEAALLRLPLQVERLRHGQQVTAGTLWLCPPRAFVELLPDGSCVLEANPQGALAKPIDRLFSSVARSFGPRAIAVVLSGMGADGARGAKELRATGACVLVQSPGSAEYPEMPAAAMATGAVDLVVPVDDIGEVVVEFAQGAPRRQARTELRAIAAVFGRAGDARSTADARDDVRAAAHTVDWVRTPPGAVISWHDDLKWLVRDALATPYAVSIWWGDALTEIYNDALRPFLGDRHPQALGRSARQTWASEWPHIGLRAEQAWREGKATADESVVIQVPEAGGTRQVVASVFFAPLRDAAGKLLGLRCTMWETTQSVVAQRRMGLLQALGARMARASTRLEACMQAAEALSAHRADVPFALLYLLEPPRAQATLASATGLAAGSALAPRLVHLHGLDLDGWPFAQVLGEAAARAAVPFMVDRLETHFRGAEASAQLQAWEGRPERAVMLPLHMAPPGAAQGVLVLGLAPDRPYDDTYARFVETVGRQLAAGIGEARSKELEHERLDRLTALDKARTEFFENVSHEFRTPLTLLLAPLDELGREREALPPAVLAQLDVAARNARRLLRLVNNLLDFSRIETRGHLAPVAPTDLGRLTLDVASAFRSAIEAAGLALRVEVAADLPAVPVNSTMWEQIVSNLVSNAFKFTFEGAITVRLAALRLHAELVVADTGVGIAPDELPNIFKRFHRVRGVRARTAEGAGIGLAMVHDFVQRMGGQLTATSVLGKGSEFKVWLPMKALWVRDDAVAGGPGARQPAVVADLADEVSRWTGVATPSGVIEDMLDRPAPARAPSDPARGRLLVVDDNADLRAYLHRLLSGRWEVTLASGGEQALAQARREAPDLVLADVMMPGLDGFALLQRLREEPALAQVPVVLLTARAGEDAAIEGLRAGAADYIAKPFSPRELLARLQAALDRARAEAELRASEERYRSLFDTMSEGVAINELIRDEAGQVVDARYLALNAAYQAQTGFDLSSAIGRRASEVFPDYYRDWLRIMERVVQAGRAQRFEHFVPETRRWFSFAAVPFGGRDGFAVFYDNITERKQAEAALRASEERQAFLLGLSDVLRPLEAAAEIQGEATRLLREHLAAGWCYYVEWDEAAARGVVLRDATRDGLPSLAGTHDVSDQQAFLDLLREGRVLNVSDYAAFDGLSPALRARYTALGFRSMLMATLVKQGRLVASLLVGDTEVREWSADAETLLMEVAQRTWAAVERARAEAALRESEERQAFLLTLSDALRALGDPRGIKLAASGVLGRHLGVQRAFYAEVEGDDWLVAKGHEQGVAPLADGPYSADRFGRWIMQAYRDGRRIVFRDVRNDPRFAAAERQAHLAAEIVGAVGVPLVKDGKLVAIFAVHTAAPRDWTDAEIGLVEETAERTWAAVERARAEAALRASEEKFRTLFETMDEGYLIGEVIFDADNKAVDILYRHANPAAIRLAGRDFTGQRMRDIDARYEAYWYEAYGRVVRTGEPVRAEHYAEPHGRWFDFQLSRIGGPGSRLVASLFQDITERKRSEAALRESEARLARELEDAQRLQRISSILIQRDDGAIFEELIDAAQALMQADCASLQVMDRNKGELELLAWRGFHPESAAHWQRVAVGSGTSCAAALAHGERLLIEDVAGWAHADAATLAHWRLSGIRAVQSTPLVARDGQIVGMLSTHWRHPHRPGERDLGVFGVLARQVADVLERRRAARAA